MIMLWLSFKFFKWAKLDIWPKNKLKPREVGDWLVAQPRKRGVKLGPDPLTPDAAYLVPGVFLTPCPSCLFCVQPDPSCPTEVCINITCSTKSFFTRLLGRNLSSWMSFLNYLLCFFPFSPLTSSIVTLSCLSSIATVAGIWGSGTVWGSNFITTF